MDIRDYRLIFDVDGVRTPLQWQSGTIGQRTRRIQAGEILYVDTYPIWDAAHARVARDAAEHRAATPAMAKINQANRERNLAILMNANFGIGDYMLTLTYSDDNQPDSSERARKDAVNYMRRLKTLRSSRGLTPLKYIFTVEETHRQSDGKSKYHIHALINSEGITRDEAEERWHGGLANCRKAQNQVGQFAGYAKYTLKSKTEHNKDQAVTTSRLYYRSRNLKVPQPTYADHKISRRRAEKLATDTDDARREIFRRLYPGYTVIETICTTSSILPGVYIRAVLQKEETNGKPTGKRVQNNSDRGGGAKSTPPVGRSHDA